MWHGKGQHCWDSSRLARWSGLAGVIPTPKEQQMVKTTRPQREALHRVYVRIVQAQKPSAKLISYRQFRSTVQPGSCCIMVPFAGMWLGIEHDGYTHS